MSTDEEIIEEAKALEARLNEFHYKAMLNDVKVKVMGRTSYLDDGKVLVVHTIELERVVKIL